VKILHYHQAVRLESGGVVRCVLDLCAGLAEAGHEVTLLTTDDRDVPEEWKRGGADQPRSVVLDAPRLPGGFFAPGAGRRLREHVGAADVLHLHAMWTPANVQLAAAARRTGVPYVYSVHGMLDDWCMSQRTTKKRIFLGLFGRRMLHEAAAVHCTARAELEQARPWFPKGRGVVVPLVMDLSPFEELPGPEPARARFPLLEGDAPRLLFLSRVHYKKGIELLIRAADVLRRRDRVVDVIVAGTGEDAYLRELETLARSLGVDDRVHFPGFVSGVEKVSLYQAADVFVLPTSQENFGFVLFEALAAATPVVTTRGADTWPELEAGGGAVIVDADPEAIAGAAAAILDDPARGRAMGDAGRAWVFDNLAGTQVIGGFERLYAEAVGV
jgi:glycosyltransferase involved in cell wall biosynthesis